MIEKFEIPRSLQGKTFLSKKAGGPSGVPQATVQAWTDKGLIISPTTGTGDRREYTPLNCIEIGLIKCLSGVRLPMKHIGKVMDEVRGGTPLTLEQALGYKRSYLIIRFYVDGGIAATCVSDREYGPRNAEVTEDGVIDPENRTLLEFWIQTTIPKDKRHVKTLVVDLKYIEEKVLRGLV